MKTVIFHIDVNSAFLSWEAVYRLREQGGTVDLREIASAVGGDKSKRRGIILAKSLSAKACGVRTGEPLTDALKKCPGLTVVPAHHAMYRQYSAKFMEILREYSPDVEQYSIDEAFMDMSGMEHLIGEPVAFAHRLKNRISKELGFTVNIGISDKKYLAKMASDFEKPDKVHTLFPEEIRVKMWPLPIGELYMAGHSSVEILKKLEILTIGDLAQADPRLITLHLKSHGQMLWEFANGIDHSSVQSQQAEAKGVGNSTTLSKDAETLEEIRPVFAHLAASVGERLKKAGQKASMVSMEIKYYDFRKISHQKQLMRPTSDQNVLYESACELFEEVWTGEPVRLLGIRTAKLVDEKEPMQLSIFDIEIPKPLDEKHQKLKDAMEKLDARFGKGTVIKASLMKKEPDTKEKDEKRR